MKTGTQILSLCLVMLVLTTTPAFAASGPKAQVEETVEAIIALLRDKSLERDTRRDKIRKLIYARFDFQLMSQRTLSTNWKKASAEQKDRFVQLFSELLEWSYISRIEAYTNEKVEYLGEKIKKNRAQVDTFILSGGTEIPLNYRLINKGDEWFVYDVIIEQISLISNYRSSYRTIVKNDGIDGLLVQMEQKIAELKASADKVESAS